MQLRTLVDGLLCVGFDDAALAGDIGRETGKKIVFARQVADKGSCPVVLEQVAKGLALVEQKPLTLANAGPAFARILQGVTEFEFGGGSLFKAKTRRLDLIGWQGVFYVVPVPKS